MSDVVKLTLADTRHLFELLNEELRAIDTHAELYLVGGGVMCLVLGTREVRAWFRPSAVVRTAAARVGVPAGWLNDAVNGWLSSRRTFDRYLGQSHFQVFVAQPGYLLALKCMAMRLGAEFHDLADVRYLLRHLDIRSAEAAM